MNIGCVIVVGVLLTAELSECLECFNCQNIVDPHACTNTSQCSNGQSCFVQTVHNGNGDLFNMGCQSNQLCSSSGVDAGAIIGRSIQRRQHYACHECCSTNSCNGQLCAHKTLDGNWSEWAPWTACSVTCQNGTQTRARSCTNPSPSNGGLDCSGASDQNKMCSNQLGPVHGNWTEWSTWSGCSVTCDVGLRDRIRTCSNPKPDRNGDNCVGNPSEYTVCLTDPCYTRNGGWSSWGSWQSCSVTCGVGLRLRHRTCTNPIPSAYGKGCEGNSETSAVCVNRPCTTVAFIAHGLPSVLANLVSVFPTIVFNDGNAYSPSTGHFRAPVDGLYSFTTQICTNGRNSGSYAYFAIEKGSASMTNITRLTASLNEDSFGSCSSASTHVQLSRNENVWVKMIHLYSSSNFADNVDVWNFLTGCLFKKFR